MKQPNSFLTKALLGLAVTASLTLGPGCATSGVSESGDDATRELTPDDITEFQHRLSATVHQELREAGVQATIQTVAIKRAERIRNGGVVLTYHLVYETNDPKLGQVTHELDSKATVARDVFQVSDLERTVVWRLVEVAPPEQSLIFHDPLIVGTPAPAGGSGQGSSP